MNDLFGQLQREVERREQGFSPLDLLDLPLLERQVMTLFVRHSHLSLVEVVEKLNADAEAVQTILDDFVNRGYLLAFQSEGQPRYRPLFARKRPRELPRSIWAAVEELLS
jgi:predicted transcriptional regulator